jgi:hypothetical protein
MGLCWACLELESGIRYQRFDKSFFNDYTIIPVNEGERESKSKTENESDIYKIIPVNENEVEVEVVDVDLNDVSVNS